MLKQLSALVLCGTSLAAWAETAQQASPNDHLVQTTLGLLFVLGLLMALAWVLKRAGLAPQSKRGGFYKVIAMSHLGPREKIALIEVGDTWLVVGMTAHSINTLHTLPAGSLTVEEAANPAATFAKLLNKVQAGKAKAS
ncbi:MAG: flagellar biosynthetic protein FliO [Limnobacter sp.]|jgi:flagellar protein FliO/FliZ|uniref:flagellar biosynthetic protein FliO n=1 Tax=Limnobacter sp. TaxID=2003368 RepID=UPI00391AFB73